MTKLVPSSLAADLDDNNDVGIHGDALHQWLQQAPAL